MANRFESRNVMKLAVAGAGALAATAAVLVWGAGTAGADVVDIKPEPIVNGQTSAEGGNRSSEVGIANAGGSDVRASRVGSPLAPAGGSVKDSQRAVPGITGGIGTYINMGPAGTSPSISDW